MAKKTKRVKTEAERARESRRGEDQKRRGADPWLDDLCKAWSARLTELARRLKPPGAWPNVTGGTELAKAVGVGEGQVGRWLRDERPPSAADFVRIAEGTGHSLDWLMRSRRPGWKGTAIRQHVARQLRGLLKTLLREQDLPLSDATRPMAIDILVGRLVDLGGGEADPRALRHRVEQWLVADGTGDLPTAEELYAIGELVGTLDWMLDPSPIEIVAKQRTALGGLVNRVVERAEQSAAVQAALGLERPPDVAMAKRVGTRAVRQALALPQLIAAMGRVFADALTGSARAQHRERSEMVKQVPPIEGLLQEHLARHEAAHRRSLARQKSLPEPLPETPAKVRKQAQTKAPPKGRKRA